MTADRFPSMTAQRVAAYRLGFERLTAPYGDPSADERLTRDVAASLAAPTNGSMHRYLQARTAFFDRVVINALEREVTQVVSIGAGYDGRAFRYAKPGVHWWEVDHPDTQADKRARVERLGLSAAETTFVSFDLRTQGLATALTANAYEPDAPSLILCEGVAVYLEPGALERLFRDSRSVATVGTRWPPPGRRRPQMGSAPNDGSVFGPPWPLGESRPGTRSPPKMPLIY